MVGPNQSEDPSPAASVADPYLDLLATLSYAQRQGLVQRLATGYYDGWRPSRVEVGELIVRENGWIPVHEREALLVLAREPVADPTPPVSSLPPPRSSPLSDPSTSLGSSRPGGAASRLRSAPGATAATPDATATPATSAARATAADPARPRAMLQFEIACPEVAAPAEFIARGMSSGPWITRGNRVCRLVSLHYALLQPAGRPPFDDAPAFNGAIRCRPDAPAPADAGDGEQNQHLLRSGRIIGVRGPWPIPPAARRVGFLIHPHSAPGDDTQHHPVGTLLIDLTTNRAQWRPLSGLHSDTLGSGDQRIAPG